jgi:hypothetical protein
MVEFIQDRYYRVSLKPMALPELSAERVMRVRAAARCLVLMMLSSERHRFSVLAFLPEPARADVRCFCGAALLT